VEAAFASAGTLSLTAVVVAWALWLMSRFRASRTLRLLPLGIMPCVATPLVLAGVLADRVLSEVANGTLLAFALIVSVGTLLHASRMEPLERTPTGQ
jgi:hypothetical protein